uniref:BTB domain-containing protein n=1 Tax=Panagrolaimus sp. JU765 TaxID=591449 RepID=A0AC34RNQ5_9BILA
MDDSKDDRESPGPSMEANFEVDDEYDQPRGSSTNRSVSSDKNATPRNDSTKTSPKKSLPRETDSGYHRQESQEKDEPLMTSFRDLASSDSPMCLSGYSDRNQYDIVEEDENDPEFSSFGQHGRFLRLEDSGIVPGSGSVGPTSRTQSPVKRKSSTKIFPMFIGFTGAESEMSQSMPEPMSHQSPYSSTQTLSAGSIRGRAMLARRLSVSSLTSLTSIDLTPTTESVANFGDKMPCSKLAADLLEMYQKSVDTDVIIATDEGDLHAHKCILWATCPSFRKSLKKSNKIEICGFSKNSIDFLLTFLYGGLTTIPEDVEVWEVVSLATHLGIEEL